MSTDTDHEVEEGAARAHHDDVGLGLAPGSGRTLPLNSKKLTGILQVQEVGTTVEVPAVKVQLVQSVKSVSYTHLTLPTNREV